MRQVARIVTFVLGLCVAGQAVNFELTPGGRLIAIESDEVLIPVNTDVFFQFEGSPHHRMLSGSGIEWQMAADGSAERSGPVELAENKMLYVEQHLSPGDDALTFRMTFRTDEPVTLSYLNVEMHLPHAHFNGATATLESASRMTFCALPIQDVPDGPRLEGTGRAVELGAPALCRSLRVACDRELRISVAESEWVGDNLYKVRFVIPADAFQKPGGGRETVSFRISAHADVPESDAQVLLFPDDASTPFDGFGANYVFWINGPHVEYTLDHLDLAIARTQMSLAEWVPDSEDMDLPQRNDRPGTNLRTEFELTQRIEEKKIPWAIAIWRLPTWMYVNKEDASPHTMKRKVDPERYDELIESIGSYLVYGKEKYGTEPEWFSFNEPDTGSYVIFTPEEHAELNRRLGAHFGGLGLKTKMLVADTAMMLDTPAYAVPTLNDPAARQHAGALSFHTWFGGSIEQMKAWRNLADASGLPLMLGEFGTDPLAWRDQSWDTETCAIEELRLLFDLMRHGRPQSVLYWEFTGDYSLFKHESDGAQRPEDLVPGMRYWIQKQLMAFAPAGSELLHCETTHPEIKAFAVRKNGELSLFLANLAGERSVGLRGLPDQSWTRICTTDEKGFAVDAMTQTMNGALELNLPARSLSVLSTLPPPALTEPGFEKGDQQ